MNDYNTVSSSVPVRETEINRVMNDLTKSIECLTQSVEATEARLIGIVRSNLPSAKKSEVHEQVYQTSLAQNINSIHERILYLKERLDDLLNRVEL